MTQIRLKLLREKAGLSQYDLADKLGVRQSTVAMWESGKNKPNNSSLLALAELFNTTVDYILGIDTINSMSNRSVIRRIPVLGNISAGVPLEAIEDVIDYEEISDRDYNMNYEYFGLKINGDSMEPEYRDSDIIIVRKQDTAETGDDAVILVNGDDATFKRIRRDENGITIVPLNSAKYTPWYYTNEQIENLPVRILGIAVEVRRKIR